MSTENFLIRPGSEEARAVGCICDTEPENNRPMVDKNCPVHGLAELKAYLEDDA